jgi:CRISPR system Cascade subunit CasE
MTGWYLTRARLRQDVPAAALAPLLLPADPEARSDATHRLIWTLFADAPDRRRDFLWREEAGLGLAPGRASFLVLSERKPADAHQLFELDEAKPFAPDLRPGDRLHFSLRANPVVTRKDGRGKPHRHDVVMDKLRTFPAGEKRKEERSAVMLKEGQAWLAAQGERHGFDLLDGLRVDGYDQRRIARRGGSPARFSVLDLDGVLVIREPEPFLTAMRRGFGKAKAWGCGLMLIRRV